MDCNTRECYTVEPCECYKVEHKVVYSEDGRCRIETEERCAGTKEMDACNCRGNKLCCDFYPEKRRDGIRETYSSKEDQELLYWIRTHMTSISRYVFNDKTERDGEYRELAKKAVNAILLMINGEGKK